MRHVLIPILYRVGSTDIRLIPMLGSQPGEMSVAQSIPFQRILIIARDARKVASSPAVHLVSTTESEHYQNNNNRETDKHSPGRRIGRRRIARQMLRDNGDERPQSPLGENEGDVQADDARARTTNTQ